MIKIEIKIEIDHDPVLSQQVVAPSIEIDLAGTVRAFTRGTDRIKSNPRQFPSNRCTEPIFDPPSRSLWNRSTF